MKTLFLMLVMSFLTQIYAQDKPQSGEGALNGGGSEKAKLSLFKNEVRRIYDQIFNFFELEEAQKQYNHKLTKNGLKPIPFKDLLLKRDQIHLDVTFDRLKDQYGNTRDAVNNKGSILVSTSLDLGREFYSYMIITHEIFNQVGVEILKGDKAQDDYPYSSYISSFLKITTSKQLVLLEEMLTSEQIKAVEKYPWLNKIPKGVTIRSLADLYFSEEASRLFIYSARKSCGRPYEYLFSKVESNLFYGNCPEKKARISFQNYQQNDYGIGYWDGFDDGYIDNGDGFDDGYNDTYNVKSSDIDESQASSNRMIDGIDYCEVILNRKKYQYANTIMTIKNYEVETVSVQSTKNIKGYQQLETVLKFKDGLVDKIVCVGNFTSSGVTTQSFINTLSPLFEVNFPE